MKKKSEIARLMAGRYAVQGSFLAFFIFLAVRHQILKGGPSGTPPLDAYCPLGGLVGLYSYVVSGGFLHRLNYSNLIMLAALAAIGLVAKSAFCGWVCPFGTVQEWLGRLGRRLGIGIDVAGTRADRYGRYVKYAVLAVVVLLTAVTGTLVFRDYDPFLAFFHMGFGDMVWTSYVVLGLVVAGSLLIMRFWCRYLCPLAVFVGLWGKLGFLKVQCDNENCVSCRQCEKLCPMDIPIAGQGRITTVECNSCLECLGAQDIKDAIGLKPSWGGSRLKPAIVPVATLLLLSVTILGSQGLGWWRSKGGGGHGQGRQAAIRMTALPGADRLHAGLAEAEKSEVPSETRGGKNRANPPRRGAGGEATEEDSRTEAEGPKGSERTIEVGEREVTVMGYMTIEQVGRLTSVPAAQIIADLGLPPDTPPDSRLGRLGRIYGFKLTDVRTRLRSRLEETAKRTGQESKEDKKEGP